jgi:glutamate racemase
MPATYDPRPIGVFDSGLGGLTAVREMFRLLPHESVVYFGDTAHLPYGNKSRESVTRFSEEIADFLVRQNVKAILVACNTSSSHALGALRARHEIPVLGVIEPAARVAVERSPHGMIGVVGTLGTVSSGAYPRAIAAHAPGAHVISRACPLFVPLIEEGWTSNPITRQVAEEYLRELQGAPLESLILGCTHYPLIAPLLQELMGPGVVLVDSGAEAVRALAELLAQRGQLAAGPAEHRFYLSDAPPQFGRIAQAFLGTELPPMTIVDLNEKHPVEAAVARRAAEGAR